MTTLDEACFVPLAVLVLPVLLLPLLPAYELAMFQEFDEEPPPPPFPPTSTTPKTFTFAPPPPWLLLPFWPALLVLLSQLLLEPRFHSRLLDEVRSLELVLLPRPTCLHMALGSSLIAPQTFSVMLLVVFAESISSLMLPPT
ncbi:MAG: hypothetical protein ACO3B8_09480 [Vulcanococcus sp.]